MINLRLAAALAALAMACPADAASRRFSDDRVQQGDEAPEGYLPRLSASRGVLCVKQCPADTLPCDPPSFKIADGRCTTQWR